MSSGSETLSNPITIPVRNELDRHQRRAQSVRVWPAVSSWLRLAAHPATVRRALMTVAVVGSVLIAINHGDALMRGEINGVRVAKILLTLAVPYVVSTVSSVSTRKELGQG